MSRCTCNTKKIKIEVSRNEEIDSLHSDLHDVEDEKEEKEAMLANAALQMFENERNAYIRTLPSGWKSQLEACTTPEKLSDLVDKITRKPTVAGKATMDSPKNDQEFSSHREMLDSVYSILQHPKDHSKEEVENAEHQRKELLKSLINGKARETMKRDNRTVYKRTNLMYCPVCSRESKRLVTLDMNTQDSCPVCGYVIKDDERAR